MTTSERVVKNNPCKPSIDSLKIKDAVRATVKGGTKCSDDRQLDLIEYINNLKKENK